MPQMYFDINVDFPKTDDLLKGLGLEAGGKAQQFFTNEIMKRSDKYVPFSSGVLKGSVHPTLDFESITYTAPYVRYHWFGKLMVDPLYGKGCFYDPKTGRMWSRPGIEKIVTDKDMKYQGAPMRGPFWFDRMWLAESEEVIQDTMRFIEGNRTL